MADSTTPSIRTLRSPLGRVRGMGSAKSGTQQWWQQRVTSIALLPLSIWLVFSLAGLVARTGTSGGLIAGPSTRADGSASSPRLTPQRHRAAEGHRDFVHGEFARIRRDFGSRAPASCSGWPRRWPCCDIAL